MGEIGLEIIQSFIRGYDYFCRFFKFNEKNILNAEGNVKVIENRKLYIRNRISPLLRLIIKFLKNDTKFILIKNRVFNNVFLYKMKRN